MDLSVPGTGGQATGKICISGRAVVWGRYEYCQQDRYD